MISIIPSFLIIIFTVKYFEHLKGQSLKPPLSSTIRMFRVYLSGLHVLFYRLVSSSAKRFTIMSSGVHDFHSGSSPHLQKVVVVLGMHRSGTSLLTGTLQEAGLVLGDVVTSAPHNHKGNREALPIRELHDDLLQRSGGAWNKPPSQVVWEPIHLAFRDLVVDAYRGEACWGFKDPRSLFCLEGWLDALPQLQAVAIVRHPEAVARSLYARDHLALDEGLMLWKIYNQKLLYWMDCINVPLLHFGSDLDMFCVDAAVLIEELDLPCRQDAKSFQFPDASLQNQSPSGLQLPSEIDDLYGILLRRCINC